MGSITIPPRAGSPNAATSCATDRTEGVFVLIVFLLSALLFLLLLVMSFLNPSSSVSETEDAEWKEGDLSHFGTRQRGFLRVVEAALHSRIFIPFVRLIADGGMVSAHANCTLGSSMDMSASKIAERRRSREGAVAKCIMTL